MNRYIKTILKVFAWILGVILGLFLLIVVLIQVPFIQNILKNKAVTYLEGKIHTPVKIDRISIGLPKKIVLEGVYFQSLTKDTLLAGDKLAVDISLFKLLDNKLEINSINLQGIITNVKRTQDSVFNFDYIIKAFVSEQNKEPKPEDTSSTMKFFIEKINLDKVRVRFDDALSKNDLDLYVNHFETNIKKFDLDNMSFDVPKVILNGLNVKLKQGIIEQLAKATDDLVDTVAKSPDLKLKLGEIDLSKIKIEYDSEGTQLNTGLTLGKLLVKFNNVDLAQQFIDIKEIQLKDTQGELTLGKFEKKLPEISADTNIALPENNWRVKLRSVGFENISFKFDDENQLKLNKGIDYMHLNMKNLNLSAENLYYSSDTISGKINELTAQDKSGLDIQSLKTDFFYGPTSAYLKDLYVKTPQTLIKDDVNVTYPSISALSKYVGELGINANLKDSKLGFKDVLLFMPDLAQTNPFKSHPSAVILISSRIAGKVKDLKIPNLEVSGIGNTKILASGIIVGLPDMDKARFNLQIKNFQSSAKDINSFVPQGTIPSNIQLPGNINLKGSFNGAINNFATNLVLVSNFGSAKVKANIDQRIKNKEKYIADAELINLDLGKFLKNDSIGEISLKAKVSGVGFEPKTANANLAGVLNKAEYNSYLYKDLFIKGDIKNGLFNAIAKMDDPNLDFDLVANGSFKNKYPSVKLNANIDSADLGKLNFYKGSLRFRGKIDADVKTADPDYLNASVSLNSLLIAQEKDKFLLDSINIISIATDTINTLILKSPFLNAGVRGKYKLTQLATAISNSVAKYYDTDIDAEKKSTEEQYFNFRASLVSHPALLQFVPEIKKLEPITLTGRYNSKGDSIIVNGNIPKLIYGSNTITNGVLKIDTKDSVLNYSLLIDEIKNPQILLPKTSLIGKVENNIIDYKLQVKDKEDKERYLIAGNVKSIKTTTEFRLELEGLKLNYENWKIDQNNLISFGENGISANDFFLSNNDQSIKIQSEGVQANSPLKIDFSQFKIETLTSIAEQDSLKIGGLIDGNVLLSDLNTDMVFTSDLTIKDFNFRTDTIGDIALKVDNKLANTFTADVAITGQDNDVRLTGDYHTDNSSFDLLLNLQKLNLKSIQGFTLGNITGSSGFLSGNMKISGTTTSPKILGDLQFNNGAFRVTPLNSYFHLINDRITFNQDGILFNNFNLTDSANNKLSINGSVMTQTYTDFKFNLDVNANNFRAINSTESDNDLFYGTLFLNARLRIRGDMNQPVVDGSLKVNKDTKFTIVLPQSDPGIADREGIVEFIDQNNPQLAETFSSVDSLNKSTIMGFDVSANIEIDKEAELTMVIDKGNGDFVKLKGEAELTGGIDPSGKVTLTGRYELKEGSYEMSFNFIKRKFDIKEGSSLVWTGEPTTANIDITAIYETETAPIDLLGDQLGDVAASVRNTYKQKIPFEVLLKMNGELMKPEISFDIQLPEGNYNVSTDIVNNAQTKLEQLRQQPSELNKQVFALLLLNRFVGENPFASEAGSGGVQSMVRQSVSKILSEQLNNLAGDLIAGVELNFDLESSDDYSSGQRENRTDLNVGLSKRFLDDRLKVTVGSNFGLEGPQQANRETKNIAGDISVDYQLSKDGRYLLRAYRKNEYQVALQGQIIETGVGFILTMDYNKFREIFEKTRNRRRGNR